MIIWVITAMIIIQVLQSPSRSKAVLPQDEQFGLNWCAGKLRRRPLARGANHAGRQLRRRARKRSRKTLQQIRSIEWWSYTQTWCYRPTVLQGTFWRYHVTQHVTHYESLYLHDNRDNAWHGVLLRSVMFAAAETKSNIHLLTILNDLCTTVSGPNNPQRGGEEEWRLVTRSSEWVVKAPEHHLHDAEKQILSLIFIVINIYPGIITSFTSAEQHVVSSFPLPMYLIDNMLCSQ